ncbi:MAG: arginine decarboxylase, pyruvoyl-dependent [Chloroflexi bacterium]|nr:arginine decarboxylase, pyruvoyl-dependent [Chloroflexota bacterium]
MRLATMAGAGRRTPAPFGGSSDADREIGAVRRAAPNLLWPTLGHAEGDTRLNAFDNALIEAGVGHWNLVKVTSVVPAGASLVEAPLEIEAGAVVPAVLTSVASNRPGELITACVGVGLGAGCHGMVMEHSGPGTPEEMEPLVRRMLHESFARRRLELRTMIVHSVSHSVERVGASIAAVVLWWG